MWSCGVAVNMPACHAGDRGFDPRQLRHFYTVCDLKYAVVAELADALDSGSSGVTAVEVRVLSTAPYFAEVAQR